MTLPREPAGEVEPVDVWIARTEELAREAGALAGTLDADERDRAARFHFEEDRRRFALRRGWMRRVLATYVGGAAESLRFEYTPHGKPSLASRGEAALEFNLSHSGELAVLAVTFGRRVGVDVERRKRDRDLEGLAERFFAPDEAAAIRSLPSPARVAAFYRCWTRKEAFLKARGEGLGLPLERFSVPLEEGPGAALVRFEGDALEPTRWSREDLALDGEYAAALVAQGRGLVIRRRADLPASRPS